MATRGDFDDLVDLIPAVEVWVKNYMSRYDASHDYAHVQRVRQLAEHIAAMESSKSQEQPGVVYRLPIITVAALLHDVGDKKYRQSDSATEVQDFLVNAGATLRSAQTVQVIVSAVSYSNELAHPQLAKETLQRVPELGPVQDADRLDALGAVGIARCFTFGGAKGGNTLESSLSHFQGKLLHLEGMMKTRTGRLLAKSRTDKLKVFMGWWIDEENLQVDCP